VHIPIGFDYFDIATILSLKLGFTVFISLITEKGEAENVFSALTQESHF